MARLTSPLDRKLGTILMCRLPALFRNKFLVATTKCVDLLQIELELGIDTRGPNYDKSRGEQMALNVDGPGASGDDKANYFHSDRMDKQVTLCDMTLLQWHSICVDHFVVFCF